jgi:hypothetical protein
MKTPKVTDSTEQGFLPQKVKQRHGLLLSSSVASLAFGLLIPHFFLPALLFTLTCLGLLFLFTRKPSLFKASSSRRLQDLKGKNCWTKKNISNTAYWLIKSYLN